MSDSWLNNFRGPLIILFPPSSWLCLYKLYRAGPGPDWELQVSRSNNNKDSHCDSLLVIPHYSCVCNNYNNYYYKRQRNWLEWYIRAYKHALQPKHSISMLSNPLYNSEPNIQTAVTVASSYKYTAAWWLSMVIPYMVICNCIYFLFCVTCIMSSYIISWLILWYYQFLLLY